MTRRQARAAGITFSKRQARRFLPGMYRGLGRVADRVRDEIIKEHLARMYPAVPGVKLVPTGEENTFMLVPRG